MSESNPLHAKHLPLYQKALEIFMLSRNISTYLSQDLCDLDSEGKEDKDIYFTGDIIQQSSNLVPEIINAERERFSDKKYKHIKNLNKLTYRLYKNCNRLEKSKSNGRDYLPILRNELKKFRKIQHNWMLTL